MQEDGQEERIHCMVIGQAHNDISGKGGGGRGLGQHIATGYMEKASTLILLPCRCPKEVTTCYGRPSGQVGSNAWHIANNDVFISAVHC